MIMNIKNELPITAMGAAVAAALSAYWMASRQLKNDSKSEEGDVNMRTFMYRLEDMQKRLDRLEKEREKGREKEREKEKTGRRSRIKGDLRGRATDSFQQQKQPKSHLSREDEADSNVNILPSAFGDEGDLNLKKYTLPKTVDTKGKEHQDQFLSLPHQDSTKSSMHSHHSVQCGNNNKNASASASTCYHEAVPVVLISDPGQDLDDEMMFIMARHLNSLDLISLQGVIANLSPSFARARLTRGTLDLLGLHRVPVGIGTDGGDVLGKHSSDQFEETASSYIVHEDGEAARGLESGHRLLQRLYVSAAETEYVDAVFDDDDDDNIDHGREQDDNEMKEDEVQNKNNGSCNKFSKKQAKKVVKGGLSIVITSSMKDMAIFVRDNPTLFASKTREVVVMGGCKPVQIEDTKTALAMASSGCDGSHNSQYSASNVWSNLAGVECEPDSAHNNTFDPSSAAFLYSQCQKMNITFTVVSRYAAYAAKMPRSVYDDLALTGSSIGWRLRNSQRASIDQLWQRACSLDPNVRKGLPPRCDRKWFINTFCGGDDDPSRCSEDTAWDLVTGFMQYDTIALLAAIPAVREKYFDPFVLPPLQKPPLVREKSPSNSPCMEEELKVIDLSDVTREEDETVSAAGGSRCRSSVVTGRAGEGGGGDCQRRSPAHRTSCPGPRAIQRAIVQVKEDSKWTEAPLHSYSPEGLTPIPVAFARGTRNLIGITDIEHNLKDPQLLVNLLKTGYRQGILCNHHTQPHIILHLQLRWDNLADTLLTCLMLRSLWDMRLASVLGVIVSISPNDSDQAKCPSDGMTVSDVDGNEQATEEDSGGSKEKHILDVTADCASDNESNEEMVTNKAHPDSHRPSLCALAKSIRATLKSIGLAHVKFLIVSGENMENHKKQSADAFLKLYESAPPIGVTLVLTATFTSAWPFAEAHPDLFRNKTVRVVHTGGALIWPARWGWAALPFSHRRDDEESADANIEDPSLNKGELTSEQILVPDPAAQNHRLDISSARLFYKRAQALSVPMVILSRHVAKECCIPCNFFHVLGSHGGEVGRRIYDSERNSLLNLWRCSCAPVGSAARGNLPERCDERWFADNFCAGKLAGSEEEIWRSVEAVNLYSPIALLAALPGETVQSYFQTMPFPVRSATHHVIGLTEEVPPRNVTNPSELRSLVVQSLLSAALANESVFGRDPPPMVPVRMDHEKRRGWDVGPGGGSSGGSSLWSNGKRRSSIISARSTSAVDEVEDMWTFSEAARRELFSRTVAQMSKNAILPKEKTRKFVMTNESRIAATLGFIPPQNTGEKNH